MPARLIELKSDEIYFPHVVRLIGLQHDLAGDEALAAKAGATVFCRQIDAELADREHLAGDFSFADIAFYMAQLFGERMGAQLDDSTTKVLGWRHQFSARPSVRAVVRPMDFLAANGRPVPGFLAHL